MNTEAAQSARPPCCTPPYNLSAVPVPGRKAGEHMARAYIKIFHDCLECMEPLDDAERGRLFTALLEYARTGEAPALQGNERFVFPALRTQLDRDAASYESLCETNQRNGARGGRPSRKPSGFSETEKTQDKQDHNEKDKDKAKDKDSSSGADRPGQPDRAPGRRPAGRSRPERKYHSRKGAGAVDPAENQRLIAEMLRYRDQLRRDSGAGPDSHWPADGPGGVTAPRRPPSANPPPAPARPPAPAPWEPGSE